MTVVGWVEAPWEHVHFSERQNGVYVNPLRQGALGPFVDTTIPLVKQLHAEVGGRPVSLARGAIDLVVEAYDETPVRVSGRWGGKPVTPALLRWRLTTAAGRVVRPWRSAIDHRLTIPSDELFTTQYGRWTRQNKQQPTGPLPLRAPGRLGQPRGRRTAATSSKSRPPTFAATPASVGFRSGSRTEPPSDPHDESGVGQTPFFESPGHPGSRASSRYRSVCCP